MMFGSGIIERMHGAIRELSLLDEDERIEVINELRRMLHEVSPYKSEPVDCVQWVPSGQVRGNAYNPNAVAPPEMRLLKHSIQADGYTQPIVAFRHSDEDYEVVDGFHRYRVGTETKAIRNRIKGRLPLSVINADRADIKDRIGATIRHNRARGKHGIDPMIDVVADLIIQGWADEDVAKELGMSADEVLRLKQCSGLPALFSKGEFSKSWE